jgi:hypothetical protein
LTDDDVIKFTINAPGVITFFTGEIIRGLSAAETVIDAKFFANFFIDVPDFAGAPESSLEVSDAVEETLSELRSDSGFRAQGGDELVAELERGGSGLRIIEEVLDGFGGEVTNLIE